MVSNKDESLMLKLIGSYIMYKADSFMLLEMTDLLDGDEVLIRLKRKKDYKNSRAITKEDFTANFMCEFATNKEGES